MKLTTLISLIIHNIFVSDSSPAAPNRYQSDLGKDFARDLSCKKLYIFPVSIKDGSRFGDE